MPAPKYDDIKNKVRDWSNKREAATTPEVIIEDCLRYGADYIYRELRIPQMEHTTTFVVNESQNSIEDKYTVLDVPQDLIEFIYLRNMSATPVRLYNEVTDIRTFLDPYAEQYSTNRYVWKDLQILIHPKLKEGDTVELHYYRRLAQLDATYSVIPENYNPEYTFDNQPLLAIPATEEEGTGVVLYLVLEGIKDAAFLTASEATAYAVTNGGVAIPQEYLGKEAWNWLRDAQQSMLLTSALSFLGAYLFDDAMEAKYKARTDEMLTKLNREEEFRRAKGGNVRMNFNSGGLI